MLEYAYLDPEGMSTAGDYARELVGMAGGVADDTISAAIAEAFSDAESGGVGVTASDIAAVAVSAFGSLGIETMVIDRELGLGLAVVVHY